MSYLQHQLNVSVKDVYDFAYDIAQEFEQIVFLYGIDEVKPVVDKVIDVLELLESSIKKIEQLEDEVGDLKSNNLQLSSEIIVGDQEKSKLKQIYEEREESWLEEVMNLKSQLSLLKSENLSLKTHLHFKKESYSKSDDAVNETIQDQESVIHKLKHMIKQKDKQLQDNACNLSALNSRIQELFEMNKNLHSKNQEAKTDISKLLVEKNDLKSESVLQKKENILLRESMDELINSSLRMHKVNSRFSRGESSECTIEDALLKDTTVSKPEEKILQKIKLLQAELQCIKSKKFQQSEENIFKLNPDQKKMPFSKIHQLFHLFLGITAISEICCF